MIIGLVWVFLFVSKKLSCVCSSQLLLQGGIASLYAKSVQICAVDCLTKFRIIFKLFWELYFLQIYTKAVSNFLIYFLSQKDP